MPENQAAYLEGTKVNPLVVKSAPYTAPGPDQIVVKNAAIAVNPLEDVKQSLGDFLYGWVKYPFVMGSDVSGVVVEVGSNVTRFKVGDRVVGHALGMEKKYNASAMGGFQLYTVLLAKMASPIPASLEFSKAVVMPLALSTASCGLFEKDQLALRYPKVGTKKGGKSEMLLIWGGSTSVGCNAIQLATAAGYNVVTTCSPRNFDLVKRLGASAAFDYNSSTAVDEIVRLCQGKQVAGAMSIGDGDSAIRCAEVLSKCQGNRFISLVSFPSPKNKDAGVPGMIWAMTSWQTTMMFKCLPKGIKRAFVWGSSLAENEVGKAVWEDYLPMALEENEYTAAPEPQVVGTGLSFVQEALDMLHKGVSAKKCVVSLE